MKHALRHVLMTTDAVGGVWTYALELGAALAAGGTAVTLALLGPVPTARQMAMVPAGVTLHETNLPLDWTVADLPKLLEIAAGLAGLACSLRVDLVHLHSPALMGTANWPAPVVVVAHSCLGTWWEAVRGAQAPPEDFRWRMAQTAHGIAAADTVIAPSKALAAALGRVYGVRRQICVVHNGGTPRVAPPARLANGVLVAGRLWDEGKNIALIDEAAEMMPLPVLAAGPTAGPNGTAISLRAIRSLGVLDSFGMVEAFASTRVFASPALYEPFGLAVLEAAHAGLPLVLSDISTFRELWDGAALFLPARAPGAWARALTVLHDDGAECSRLGQAAQIRAAHYGQARFAAKMRGLFERTLQTAQTKAA